MSGRMVTRRSDTFRKRNAEKAGLGGGIERAFFFPPSLSLISSSLMQEGGGQFSPPDFPGKPVQLICNIDFLFSSKYLSEWKYLPSLLPVKDDASKNIEALPKLFPRHLRSAAEHVLGIVRIQQKKIAHRPLPVRRSGGGAAHVA